ncbi:response regulator [Magnetospirillum aberrantis]|uniref:Response regulator n=1 Tax=Magnetospirillum aberrantis SpK TaxID=908842 RepID=A0A7C9USA0_9PROT|nr:response regulator [Magnetospirillum aberrantis]NFV79168.1 response regulator [Magnetospirillum aberrantis SpK]
MTRILVVESEVRARHGLRSILEEAGYDVSTAADMTEGANIHSNRAVDLVVTGDMEGPARLLFAGARVLAVPGGVAGREHDVAERVRAMGAVHFLPKPFRRDALLAAVRVSLSMDCHQF